MREPSSVDCSGGGSPQCRLHAAGVTVPHLRTRLQVFFAHSRFPRTVVYGITDLATWLATGRSSEDARDAQLRPLSCAGSLRPVGEGLASLVGNTPLIRLKSLSEQTGCEVGS